jgi:hypothetical protein
MKGAALTYARRYALFTLVGIAGEDDLDAPDIPQKENSSPERVPLCSDSNAGVHAPAINNGKTSAILRDRLLKEMAETAGEEALAVWAKRALPLKNGLTEDDARSVEAAYLASVNNATENALLPPSLEAHAAGDQSKPDPIGSTVSTQVTPMSKPIRKRSKVHLSLVASQSCLVCRQGPCDAHHLKMAQPRSLGRKVSDEFTVPLCRRHHCDLHRHGNERAWWQNHGIDPLPVAAALWEKTHPIAAIPSATTFEPGDLTNGLLVDTRHKNNETNPILHPEAR